MSKNNFVLVTGGSKGIGASISQKLIMEGFCPLILDIIEPASLSGIEFIKVDLSKPDQTKNVMDRVSRKYSITRLVNNVGIVKPASLETTRLKDFSEVMSVNAQAAMLCVQAVIPTMRSIKFGRIVNITTRAVLGKELRTAYSASKAALGAMTRTWALELASYGITVNAIAPGPIGTEAFKKNNPPEDPRTTEIVNKIPVKRMGKPEDVAHAVNFLLHQDSGFITGQTLYVCGGITVGLSS